MNDQMDDLEVDDDEGGGHEELTAEEEQLMADLLAPYKQVEGYDIPYAWSSDGFTIAGTLRVREPVERTSTDGVVTGVVNGTYNINRRRLDASFYGVMVRVKVRIRLTRGTVQGRFDTQSGIGGRWNKGDWRTIARF